MTDPATYPLRVFPSKEDGGFIAEAIDLPGCSAFGETAAEACAELQDAISAWIDAANTAGNVIPEPMNVAVASSYSGRLAVRLPRLLHATLSQQAREEGVSLNSYLISVLAEGAANARYAYAYKAGVKNLFFAKTEQHSIIISNVALHNEWFQSYPGNTILASVSESSNVPYIVATASQLEYKHG